MNLAKIAIVNFMVLSSLLLILEIGLQALYFLKNGHFLFGDNTSLHNKIFEIHPYLVGRPRKSKTIVSNGNKISTTRFNTRSTGTDFENIDNKITIAVLGGSTAFGTGVGDEDSWPYLLQSRLGDNYRVINFGVPGYSTVEHIIQLSFIIPDYNPDYIILYEGWNDIRNYHFKTVSSDYYEHGIKQYASLDVNDYIEENKMLYMSNISGIFWFAKRLKELVSKKNIDNYYCHPDERVDNLYARNIKQIISLASGLDATTVLIPQLLNFHFYDTNNGSFPWTRNIDNKCMRKLMGKFNKILGKTCIGEKKKCNYLNVYRYSTWVTDDFIDEGHLSKKGGIKMAELINDFIRKKEIVQNKQFIKY